MTVIDERLHLLKLHPCARVERGRLAGNCRSCGADSMSARNLRSSDRRARDGNLPGHPRAITSKRGGSAGTQDHGSLSRRRGPVWGRGRRLGGAESCGVRRARSFHALKDRLRPSALSLPRSTTFSASTLRGRWPNRSSERSSTIGSRIGREWSRFSINRTRLAS